MPLATSVMDVDCFGSFSITHSPPSDLTRVQPQGYPFFHSQFEAFFNFFFVASVVLHMVPLLQQVLTREQAVKPLHKQQSRF